MGEREQRLSGRNGRDGAGVEWERVGEREQRWNGKGGEREQREVGGVGAVGGGGRNSIQVLGAWVSKDRPSGTSNQLVRL